MSVKRMLSENGHERLGRKGGGEKGGRRKQKKGVEEEMKMSFWTAKKRKEEKPEKVVGDEFARCNLTSFHH